MCTLGRVILIQISKRNFESDINRSRDRNSLSLSLSAGNETPSNTNENFSTRDTDTGEGGAHIHRPIAVNEAVAARKVRCQMLPTSVINPNTNLLFPSADPRRGLKSWESWCRRLSFLQCFSWSGFVLKSLHAIRKYRNRHRCVIVIRISEMLREL